MDLFGYGCHAGRQSLLVERDVSARSNLSKQHYSEDTLDRMVLDRVRRSTIPVWGGTLTLPEQAAAGRLMSQGLIRHNGEGWIPNAK